MMPLSVTGRTSAASLVGFCLFLLAPPASADFVQTMTCYPTGMFQCRPGETPLPVQWPQRRISYHINENGSADLHTGLISDDLKESIIASFETWNEPGCSDLELDYRELTPRAEIGYQEGLGEDNINVVVWRDDDWPYGSYAAVALTTVTFRPSTGVIVDADIEMNGAMYTFTDTDNPAQAIVDVRNTLTHEVGHFIGLDHTNERDATMFGTAPPGELSKRILHPVDIAGLCHIYPEGVPPVEGPDDGTTTQRRWCASGLTSHAPSSPLSVAVSLLAGGLFIRLRRRNP
jgi:hypothetical protein